MPRKRKVAVNVPIQEDEENIEPPSPKTKHGPMYTILSNAQMSETFHKKYIKEMRDLYQKMDHDAFMFTFIKMIQCAMAAEEANEHAHITLLFCAKYIASYDEEETHSVLKSTFKWLLTTISNNPHIRYRLCQFVNIMLTALGVEAALDDMICDNISSYMIDRLRDINPNVRVQAIMALQRLQVPDNPDDVVLKAYQFHLNSDPSPRVRQAVITSMGRNYNTIPYIMERLWDIDERVRRHTYFHMSGFPVRAYKVAQRITFLEQGLHDRSELVRKVVMTVMLPQWLESYNKNYLSFISALKLDANEAEIDRFRKVAKLALAEMFKSKRQNVDELIKTLPLEEEGEFAKCVPLEKLSVEVVLFWHCLIEHLQREDPDEVDSIIPELSTFCDFIRKYCDSVKTITDKWQRLEHQYLLLGLMEIASTFDLGDEIGRENLKRLLDDLLKNADIEEQTIRVIVQCTENLMPKLENRFQFFVDIVRELLDIKMLTNELSQDRSLIDELIEKYPEKKNLKLAISSLKVKVLDLQEQEMNFVQKKDYAEAQRVSEELSACRQEYMELLAPVLKELSDSGSEESRRFMSLTFQQKKLSPEILIKSLQISFYMVVSKKVDKLTPNVCEIYKDFIRRHIESNQAVVRNWAMKCGTAYSMLYEPFAKDVYTELQSQFYKNHNVRLWVTAIECIFELLDRYGCTHFEIEDKNNKSRKAGRQLYNTLENIDAEDDPSTNAGINIISLMLHFLKTCDDSSILSALINGFCRLILHGKVKNDDVMEKLLLNYFNPTTVSEINQHLGVFFEKLIKRKKQDLLQPCLLSTIHSILNATYESPLLEVKPDTVLRFVIDSTRPIYCNYGSQLHNMIAMSFLKEMLDHITNKELLKLLAKELITLEVSTENDSSVRSELKEFCEKVLECDIDAKTAKHLRDFRDFLDGIYSPSRISAQTTQDKAGSDEENEEESEEEDENRNTVNQEQAPPPANALESIPEEAEEAVEKSINRSSNISTENLPQAPSSASKDKETTNETDENEKAPEGSTEVSNTPTMYGKDNTTNLRYLRKSMNVLPQANEEHSPKKARIRNESEKTPIRTPATRRALNTSLPDGKNQNTPKRTSTRQSKAGEAPEKEKSESPKSQPNKRKTPGKEIEKSSSKTADESTVSEKPLETTNNKSTVTDEEFPDDLQPLVVSESETSLQQDNNSVSEVVEASPHVQTATRMSARTAAKLTAQKSTQQVPSATKKSASKPPSATKTPSRASTTEKSASKQQSATTAVATNKRRSSLFKSPALTGKGDNDFVNSPIRKQPRKTLQLSDTKTDTQTVKEKPTEKPSKQQQSSVQEKPNSSKKTAPAASKNTVKTVAPSKIPTILSSRHQTRNVVRNEFLLNTIVTRRTVSNSPIRNSRIQAASTPSSFSKGTSQTTETERRSAKKSTANTAVKSSRPASARRTESEVGSSRLLRQKIATRNRK